MKKFIICCLEHKEKLKDYEVLNLKVTELTNADVDKVFILPKSIQKNFYFDNFPNWKIIEIEDRHFINNLSYNKLLLSNLIYKLFLNFKFVIIYQTDAVLIKNINKISTKYDYIGAPWEKPIKYYGLNLSIGNGGLSLRKTKYFYFLTTFLFFLKKLNTNEDIIFSLFGKLKILKIPNFIIANNTFKETTSLKLIHYNDTFGFHALDKWNLNLQKNIHDNFLNTK